MSKFLIYGLSNGIGGVESIILNMCKVMSNKHSFDIMLSDGECAYAEIFAVYSTIQRINVTPWGVSRVKFRKDIKQILNERNYDYVWFNGCIMSNLDLWSVVKRFSDAKTIAHSHGSSFEEKNIIKRIILLGLHYLNRRRFIKLTDIPCMCSNKAGKWFYGEKFMNNSNVFRINNGIDVDQFRFDSHIRSQLRQELGLQEETKVLFHAGRLTDVKNQKFLIKIIADIKQNGSDAILLIAGDGPLKEDLKNYAVSLGVSSIVHFLGNRRDIQMLYQVADCFILPSFHEGFPVTLIEAQASGLPCFASDTITKEVDISNEVFWGNIINQSSTEWAIQIINTLRNIKDRSLGYYNVCKNRFSIETVCEDFQNHLLKY